MRKFVGWGLMAITVFWISACEGPQGPVGPAGANGVQGPAGPQGPVGATGSANVIYSNWTKAGTWGTADLYGIIRSYIDVTAPALSQEIIDRGVVLVYAKLTTDNNQVRQLPVTIYAQFTTEFIDFTLIANRIRIWSTPVKPPISPSPNYEFRYILIPGAQAGRLNFEEMSYEEAKVQFGLPD